MIVLKVALVSQRQGQYYQLRDSQVYSLIWSEDSSKNKEPSSCDDPNHSPGSSWG